MIISRRQGILAGLATAVAGLFGAVSRVAAEAAAPTVPLYAGGITWIDREPSEFLAPELVGTASPLPSFDTERGRFDVVYSSLDLAPFEVSFDAVKDKLVLRDRAGRHHYTAETFSYAGLLCLKDAHEASRRRINGLLAEPPRIFLAYLDRERGCISVVRLPWEAAEVLLPETEFKPMLLAMKQARHDEADRFMAERRKEGSA